MDVATYADAKRRRLSVLLLTIFATLAPIASDEVSPGESMPATCTTRGFTVSRAIRKSANGSSGGHQLGADAGAAGLQIRRA